MEKSARASEFTERAIALRDLPAVVRPRCESFCTYLLIMRTELRRVWRCEVCLQTLEAPIHREHEITRKDRQLLITSIAVLGEPPEPHQPIAAVTGVQADLFAGES